MTGPNAVVQEPSIHVIYSAGVQSIAELTLSARNAKTEEVLEKMNNTESFTQKRDAFMQFVRERLYSDQKIDMINFIKEALAKDEPDIKDNKDFLRRENHYLIKENNDVVSEETMGSAQSEQEKIERLAAFLSSVQERSKAYGYSNGDIIEILAAILSVDLNIASHAAQLLTEKLKTETGIRLHPNALLNAITLDLNLWPQAEGNKGYHLQLKSELSKYDILDIKPIGVHAEGMVDDPEAAKVYPNITPRDTGLKQEIIADVLRGIPDPLGVTITLDYQYEHGVFKTSSTSLQVGEGLAVHINKQFDQKNSLERQKALIRERTALLKKEKWRTWLKATAAAFLAGAVAVGGGLGINILLGIAAVGIVSIPATWPLVVIGVGAGMLAASIIAITVFAINRQSKKAAAQLSRIDAELNQIAFEQAKYEGAIELLKRQASNSVASSVVAAQSASAASSPSSRRLSDASNISDAGSPAPEHTQGGTFAPAAASHSQSVAADASEKAGDAIPPSSPVIKPD